MEIIRHRRDRFSEANLSALSMPNNPHPSKFEPRDRSAADRSLTCPYQKNASFWKSSSTVGTGSAKRTCPLCQCKIQIQTPGSQRCVQVTDLSLPKNCAIVEIIQHRRDRFSEANLSALSMPNNPHPSKFKPRDRSTADRSLTCPYQKTASFWKTSSTAGTGLAKRTCPSCQCKQPPSIQIQTLGIAALRTGH